MENKKSYSYHCKSTKFTCIKNHLLGISAPGCAYNHWKRFWQGPFIKTPLLRPLLSPLKRHLLRPLMRPLIRPLMRPQMRAFIRPLMRPLLSPLLRLSLPEMRPYIKRSYFSKVVLRGPLDLDIVKGS